MADIEFVRTTTRNRVLALVTDYEAKGFSRADAMIRAGNQVGRSAAWVERIIGRRGNTAVSALDWLRLELIVAKIEASTARINQNTALVLEKKREAKKRKHAAEGDLVLGDVCGAEFLGARLGRVR